MRKGFKKITIWGQDKWEGKLYIVAEVTETENFYIANKGFNARREAIGYANTYAKLWDKQMVVIQMK